MKGLLNTWWYFFRRQAFSVFCKVCRRQRLRQNMRQQFKCNYALEKNGWWKKMLRNHLKYISKDDRKSKENILLWFIHSNLSQPRRKKASSTNKKETFFSHLLERSKMKNSFETIKIISWLFFNRMNCWQMESVKWNNFSFL